MTLTNPIPLARRTTLHAALRIGQDGLSRLRDPRAGQAAIGWAGRSLESTIERSLLFGVVAMQIIMVAASLLSLGLHASGLFLATGHLAAIGVALAIVRFGRGRLLLILGSWTLFLVDWTLSPMPESTLLFAACWLCNLTAAFPVFLLRRKMSWIVPTGAAIAVPLLMIIARPDLAAHPLVPGVFVTTIAITIATRIGVSYLIDYTRGIDVETLELQRTMTVLTAQKVATQQAAEDTRVLHDTAINTLGAIANGGAALNDLNKVRRRCLDDLAAIQTLRSMRPQDTPAHHGFRDAIRCSDMSVRFEGPSDEELAATEASIPPPVTRAFSRAIAEAVQNAEKHSGAKEVVVSIQCTSASIRVRVMDRGIGIRHGKRNGTGIERSILARTREVGIQTKIESAPDQGTNVTFEYVFDDATRHPPLEDKVAGGVERLVAALRAQAAFVLSAGLVGVGITLAALNHPGEATPEWLMVAVVAIACGLAWRERHRDRLSGWTKTALILAGPLAFLLSAWAVGFGQVNPVLWQAIAPTGPLLALIIVSQSKTYKVMGLAAYLLTILATAAAMATASQEAASVIVTAGLVGLGLIWGVTNFVRSLATVATRAQKEQHETLQAHLEVAAVEAASEARRRWRDSGLEHSIELLQDIGEGVFDPRDPAVQARCAREEVFLRQLSLLNPELTQMGAWFARALSVSRTRGVGLTVRSGFVDAAAEDAPKLGHALIKVVETMPAGSKLTTTFFPTKHGLAMTLVAPTPYLVSALDHNTLQRHPFRLQTLGNQDFVEFIVAV